MNDNQNPDYTAPLMSIAQAITDANPVSIVQVVMTQSGAGATGTTLMPFDDTIPQITEGNEFMTLTITPMSATNILIIEVNAFVSNSAANNWQTFALFQDSTANALAAVPFRVEATATVGQNPPLRHTMIAGTTSPTTFRFRSGGSNAGTSTFNGTSGSRQLGGVMASSIVITEYKG